MSLDAYLTREPSDRYDGPDPQREDEAIREARWAEFRAFVRQARVPVLLRHVADLMDGQRDPYYHAMRVTEVLESFQDTEGWNGVLSAIAQAMQKESGQ